MRNTGLENANQGTVPRFLIRPLPSAIQGCLFLVCGFSVLSFITGPTIGRDPGPNHGCFHSKPNELTCPLQRTLSIYQLDGKYQEYLKLTNMDHTEIPVGSIRGSVTGSQAFFEYCVSKKIYSTGQLAQDIGEIGCISKNIGKELEDIRWGGNIIVDAGDSIYIGFNPHSSQIHFSLAVDAAEGARPLSILRQPALDTSIKCSGSKQFTSLRPSVNASKKTVYISDILIYAQSGNVNQPRMVDGACLSILSSGVSRFSSCVGLSTAGLRKINEVAVAAGEAVVGQAWNICPVNHLWDWAAYLSLSKHGN